MHSKNLITTFYNLFELGYPIAIHKSQRPFVWDIDKVNRLIEDLEEFESRCNQHELNDLSYYLGTIVLYKNTEGRRAQFELVDGQQRLTTLLMLDHYANKNSSVLILKPDKVILEFSSSISIQNIQKVKQFLTNSKTQKRLEVLEKVLKKRLVFTVVEAETEDDAFTYFDTQNNRGKKPSIDVVLKAVHLWGIHDDENLQQACAQKWEKIERYAYHDTYVPGNGETFLYPFLKFILWRSRAWKFNQGSFGNDQDIEYMFSRHLPANTNNSIRFFGQTVDPCWRDQVVDPQIHNIVMQVDPTAYNNAENLPFQLRQPLNKGYSFFLYIEKYAAIYRRLFSGIQNDQSNQIKEFRSFYKNVYQPQSNYMKQYYLLCIMMYYDKFGDDRLVPFALALDYFVGADRISNYYIYEERYRNTNNKCNILDAIQMAYTPEEVIDFILEDRITEQKKVGSVNKVITSYLYEVLNFYEGIRKHVPYKITSIQTNVENEVSKDALVNELNQLVAKRKGWVLERIN